jgi:Mg2+ and Co2+ transporter CorA
MQLAAHQISAERTLTPCSVDQAIRESREGGGTYWIDVSNYLDSELPVWISQLELPPFITMRLEQLGRITQVLPLPRALLIELRVLSDLDSNLPHQVAALCIEHLLITFDPRTEARPDVELTLTEASPAGVLLALLLFNANRVSAEIRQVRKRLFALDERMDRDPASVKLSEILDTKDALLRVASVAEEQLECFEGLSDSDSDILDFSGLQGTVRVLLSTSGSTDRMAGRLETRIGDLQHRHANHQQERLSNRLALLTVVSAIFLPLTLIAGIWGMNFEFMPELSHPLGYAFALGTMALVAGGMLLVFYLRGWFD